jgi:hypothetical protein
MLLVRPDFCEKTVIQVNILFKTNIFTFISGGFVADQKSIGGALSILD